MPPKTPPDPLPARPLATALGGDHNGLPGPHFARLRLHPPGPGCTDWVLAVAVGDGQSSVYLLSRSALRTFLVKVQDTRVGEGGQVEITVGQLKLTVAREQWPRVQDYFAMFEEVLQ